MPSFRPMFVGDDSGEWMLTRAHLGKPRACRVR